MLDLKSHKPKKVKLNKRKQEQQPRDWRKLFHRLLRVSLFAGGVALAVAGAMTKKLEMIEERMS